MSDLIPNPNPAPAPTANPTPEPVAQPGTVQPSGQPGQSVPAEERFGDVDPNTLPPQLKSIHDNMLKGWKEKTTKLSEERKKYEGHDAYKQKAEMLEKLQANQDFVRLWNEHVQKAQGNTDGKADPNIQAKLQEIETKLQRQEIDGMVKTFREMKDDKGEPMHPEFDALQGVELGTTAQGDKYNLLRACVELAQGNSDQEKLMNGYKNAKAIRDQIFEEGRKHGMGKMLTRVRQSTEAPGITSEKTSFNGDPRKLSVQEARELAEKRISVR